MSRSARLTIAFLFIVLLIGDRMYVWKLSSYAVNEQNQNYKEADHNQQQAQSPLLAIIADIEEFLEAHEKSLIVLSTIAIAGFTGTLWRSTTGLQDLAARQADDMKDSIAASNRSAQVAEDALAHAKVISNAELRPWVAMQLEARKDIDLRKAESPIWLTCNLHNVGKSPAHFVRCYAVGWVKNTEVQMFDMDEGRNRLRGIDKFVREQTNRFGMTFLPGEKGAIHCFFMIPKSDIEKALARYRDAKIDIFGSVRAYYSFNETLCMTEKEFRIMVAPTDDCDSVEKYLHIDIREEIIKKSRLRITSHLSNAT